ncbi:MAG TPA: hypothetical protein VHY37_07705 [Tepidisphaeraceae bacterium]|jgi:hypothetical protein|nr:hypothetical protein [Tepidisphaeraceae bacterium]
MAVDLRSNNTFARISLILMDDCLIKLEHQSTQDRVRRYSYDQIERVVIWSRPAWLRIAICAIGLLLPGILLALLTEELQIFGWVLASIGALLVCWYLYTRVATIRIIRGGQVYDLKGLYRPGRLRRFRDNLIARVQSAQAVETVEPAPSSPAAAEEPTDIPGVVTPTPQALPDDVAALPT